MNTEPADGAGGRGTEGTRVLVLTGLYPRPGSPLSGRFIHRQVVALRELGVDARVLCPVALHALPFRSDSRFAETLDGSRDSMLEGVPVRYVPYRHVPHRLSTRLEALSIVRSLDGEFDEVFAAGPDLVHGHWLFPAGHAAVELASRRGLPAVVSARGSDVHRYPRENRGIARFTRTVLARADAVVAVSHALAEEIRKLADPGPAVSVVYNGVDTERFHPGEDQVSARRRVGLPASGTLLCAVGRLMEEKGIPELFRAFRAVAADRDDVGLVLVGDGPLREEVSSRAHASGLVDRVILAGEVPHDELRHWLRACDILVHASHAEGLPNVVLEAMACGLPVVATDVGGTAEAVDDRVGRLVPPRNVDRLAAELKEIVEDPQARSELGAEGARRVRDRFTWHRSARGLAEVYVNVVGPEARVRTLECRWLPAGDRARP